MQIDDLYQQYKTTDLLRIRVETHQRYSEAPLDLDAGCRDAGQYHATSLRRVFHKLLGCLYHCLKTRTPYVEAVAFPVRLD